MATMAPIVGALAFIAFAIGLVMFLPLSALKPHRRTAKWLVIGGFASFVLALVLDPTPAPTAPINDNRQAKVDAPAAPVVAPSRSGGQRQASTTASSMLKMEGSASDAKAAGFRQCEADYYSLTCSRTGLVIFGIRVPRAFVSLTNPVGVDGPADPEKVTYSGVKLDLGSADAVARAFDRLQSEGWVEGRVRGYNNLYNPDIPFSVSRGAPGEDGVIAVTSADPAYAREQIAERAKVSAAERKQAEFVRDMAQ